MSGSNLTSHEANRFDIKEPKVDYLGWTLILASAILLGIWALKNTIALRNILLVFGALISLFYISKQVKAYVIPKQFFSARLIPLLSLFLVFGWVLMHFILFTYYPQDQFQELQSTWLRSFLAAIFGIGVAIALLKHRLGLIVIWVGVLISFIVLILQYVPRAYAAHSFYAIDWYGGYYVYIGKINAVLMGVLLVAGLGGTLIDQVRLNGFNKCVVESLLCLLAIFLTLFSYVFILDTRNGIGLTGIILIVWALYGCQLSIVMKAWKKKFFYPAIISGILIALIFSCFVFLQAKHNSGWNTLFEDVEIAAQIEKYPNWQNIEQMGYPRAMNGRQVAGNTYERVSWATVGLGLIPHHPLGIGVLYKPFSRLLEREGYIRPPGSTHSAWIEIALAFGLPGISLLLSSLFGVICYSFIASKSSIRIFLLSVSIALFVIYMLGELSTQHGIEILFYFISLLSSLVAFDKYAD